MARGEGRGGVVSHITWHLFVKDRSGKLHSLPASTARRLRQELIDNCAQQRLVQLAEMGYVEFVGKDGEAYPIGELTADQFH